MQISHLLCSAAPSQLQQDVHYASALMIQEGEEEGDCMALAQRLSDIGYDPIVRTAASACRGNNAFSQFR